MKKKFYLVFLVLTLFALFAFTGCDQAIGPDSVTPTVEKTVPETPEVETPEPEIPDEPDTIPPGEKKPYYIKTSSWTDYVVPVSASKNMRAAADAEIPLNEALKIVEAYNAANNEDQLFLTLEDTPIEEAPNCRMRIVDADTYKPKLYPGSDKVYDIMIPRAQVIAERELWRTECVIVGNGLLFVDKDPPAEISPPVDTRTDYEKYSIYMVDKDGKIVVDSTGFRYEEHCSETFITQKETVPGFDYKTVDLYFEAVLRGYNYSVYGEGTIGPTAPWHVEYGHIYTEPTE